MGRPKKYSDEEVEADPILKRRREYNERPEVKERNRKNALAFQNKYRDIILDHYGAKCECCGETMREFLAFDHRNQDGAEHRRKNHLQSGASTYRYIINNNFPPEFRVLCHNCNLAMGFYGYCPHKKKE